MLHTAGVHVPTAVRTLATLRDFAVLRAWHIVQEVHDPAPLYVPARQRMGWRSVERFLVARQATGLVIPGLHEVTTNPGRQAALRRWLQHLPAFAASPRATRRATRPPGAGRSTVSHPDPGVCAVREWSRSYVGTPASRSRLRNDAQTYLIHLRWPGDTATAVEVLDRLALEASAAIRTRLALTEEEELLMDVQIPRPDAAPADGNRAALIASSLANARLQGAQVSCFPSEDARFTTLRALLYATGGPTGCREGPAMADEFLNDPQS